MPCRMAVQADLLLSARRRYRVLVVTAWRRTCSRIFTPSSAAAVLHASTDAFPPGCRFRVRCILPVLLNPWLSRAARAPILSSPCSLLLSVRAVAGLRVRQSAYLATAGGVWDAQGPRLGAVCRVCYEILYVEVTAERERIHRGLGEGDIRPAGLKLTRSCRRGF